MKSEDPYAYALLENVLTALIFIPVLYTEFVLPSSGTAWFLGCMPVVRRASQPVAIRCFVRKTALEGRLTMSGTGSYA